MAAPTADNIRVIRITLPHYEITYPSPTRALVDAKTVLREHRLVVPRAFPEAVQDSIVIDFAVDALVFTTTLLFRLEAVAPTHSTFSWWARRKTDTDLLNLWIRTLETELDAVTPKTIPKKELRTILSVCRRTLSRNPFEALNVHWSAGPAVVAEAARTTMEELVKYRGLEQLHTDTKMLLARSITNISEISDQLTSIHERRVIRQRFVPRNQLDHARQLARDKLGIAKMRGEFAAVQEATAELAELVAP